jgi:hypothetical protein
MTTKPMRNRLRDSHSVFGDVGVVPEPESGHGSATRRLGILQLVQSMWQSAAPCHGTVPRVCPRLPTDSDCADGRPYAGNTPDPEVGVTRIEKWNCVAPVTTVGDVAMPNWNHVGTIGDDVGGQPSNPEPRVHRPAPNPALGVFTKLSAIQRNALGFRAAPTDSKSVPPRVTAPLAAPSRSAGRPPLEPQGCPTKQVHP